MKLSDRTPSRRSQWGWKICWAAALAMGAGCLTRLAIHDRFLPLIWFNSFSAYIYLPAWPLLLIALRGGRARLAATLMTIAACHLYWTAPDFMPNLRRGTKPVADNAVHLRVFSANVFSRDSYPITIRRIRETDPDLILLQEYTHSWRDALERSNLFEIYAHRKTLTREGSYGIAVLSKWPLDEPRLVQVNVVSAISATVVLDDTRLRLWHVHGPSPRYFGVTPTIDAYWTEIEQHLLREHGPLIVAGDFNLTQHSRWYGRLTALGLHSAHREAGRGFAATWPNGAWCCVPPIRIDHVLLSADAHCETIWEDAGHLSDHKPLVADVVLNAGP
ncbi:MAG: endonuclease/exonuclease/phosphatase family protein [Planctomycetales bacterium]|nr:endonuclease/exonuclease/phosphatase family protein [Planctomycetales bacterium]